VQLTRRAVLGIAVVAVAGCSKHAKPVVRPPAAAPDIAALRAARVGEVALLAAYDAKIRHASTSERAALDVERAIHATHLSALRGTASSAAAATPLHDLPHALRSSARVLRSFAVAATSGSNAALFASIAASHEAGA
jgi:hypothetical protein